MTPPPETIVPNRFGRAGGPSMAQIKEYSTLDTSSFLDVADATLLPDASALPGGSNDSYYLLWGVTATTTTAVAYFGLIYDSLVSHSANTADASTYIGFGANFQGPFFWNTEQPIKIRNGSGLKIDRVGASMVGGTHELLTLTYSIVHAGA